MDPTGVDAGCLIGSSMLSGRDGIGVLKSEKELFSSYLAGLRSGGWTGKETHIRQAFFGQFGTYLLSVVTTLPHVLDESGEQAEHLRDWAEKRFQTPFDQVPDLLAPIVDSYSRYIDEISALIS